MGDRSCDLWIGSLVCFPLPYPRSQPDQKICLERIVNKTEDSAKVSEEWYHGKRLSLSRVDKKYQNQTAQLIKLELYFMLFVHMCVYVPKSDTADTQAEPSLLSKPQGVMNTYSKLHQFRSVS